MRKLMLSAAVIAVALLTSTVVTAQAAQLATDPNAGTDVVVNDPVHPLAPQTITQNLDPYTIVDGTSVACVGAVTTENSWLRLFDLDDDHGLNIEFTVESIDWATQTVVGSLDLTVKVYCLDETLPFLYQFMTLQDSAVVALADEVLTFHNTPVGGACATDTEDMAVELHAEDCNIAGCQQCFIGMNDLGQTAPTYIASASCGINDPTDLAAIGFMSAHLILVVQGNDTHNGHPDDGGGGDVPATTGIGAMLLLLILLGSGVYFLRRRAAS
jgi:hypothetical protein